MGRQKQEDKKPKQNQSFFQKLFSCLTIEVQLQTAELLNEKNQLFAISCVKLLGYEQDGMPVDMSQHDQHNQMIATIFKFLTEKKACAPVGSHWQTIGFQGVDPRTDIRGCGMLGVLQVLYFKEQYPDSFKLIYMHS